MGKDRHWAFVGMQIVPSLFWTFLIYCLLGPQGLYKGLFSVMGIPLTSGGLLIMLGIVLLGWEVLKATHFGDKAKLELGLSIIAAFVAIAFLLYPGEFFKTEAFATIVLLQMLDVLIGALVMVAVARRDIGLLGGHDSSS